MTDEQSHLDNDVRALTDGISAIESEVAALKNKPEAAALDFSALDAAVARVTADAPAAASAPAAAPAAATAPVVDASAQTAVDGSTPDTAAIPDRADAPAAVAAADAVAAPASAGDATPVPTGDATQAAGIPTPPSSTPAPDAPTLGQ